MKYILFFLFILTVESVYGSTLYDGTTKCPKWTEEQYRALETAYNHPDAILFDLRETVAAIVMQESIVGRHLVKYRPEPNSRASWGLMHVLLSNVMVYEGIDNRWEARATIPEKMLTDDNYAITMGVNYLLKYKHLGWEKMVIRYNGSSAYLTNIRDNIKIVRECFINRRGE